MTYAILIHPGHSRAYFENSFDLFLAESTLVLPTLSVPCSTVQLTDIAGVKYMTFTTDKKLSDTDIAVLSRLSFAYAIFEKQGELLYPIEKNDYRFVDESMSSLLKYAGKTNESFTRMMLNVAATCGGWGANASLKILDPIAGKGTTLYEGLIRGYDVYGVEIADKVVAEAYQYVRKFLENAQYKHTVKTERISGENKLFTAQRYQIDMARTKENLKNHARHMEFVAGNSQYTAWYFKKNFFHIVLGDLPYGVKHSNVTDEKQTAMTRNPAQLLYSCLPGWYTVLKPGGVLALSWNTFLLSREKICELVEKAGFIVLGDEPYLHFEHRVDQAIRRDILLAVKQPENMR